MFNLLSNILMQDNLHTPHFVIVKLSEGSGNVIYHRLKRPGYRGERDIINLGSFSLIIPSCPSQLKAYFSHFEMAAAVTVVRLFVLDISEQIKLKIDNIFSLLLSIKDFHYWK